MPSTSDTTTSDDTGRERPRVDLLQVAAGALAAITAAVIGSRLGVNGTVIGAAVGSVVGTVGSNAYAHFLGRTATHVRTVVVRPARKSTSQTHAPTTALDAAGPGGAGTTGQTVDQPRPAPIPAGAASPRTRPGWRPWRTVVVAVAAGFVVALATLTVFELLSGRPLSSLTGGGSGGGTTVGRVLDSVPELTPSPSATATTTSPTPSQSTTSADSATATPTTTPTLPTSSTGPSSSAPTTTAPPTSSTATSPPTTAPSGS